MEVVKKETKENSSLSSNTSVSYFFFVFVNNAQLTLCLTDHLFSSLLFALSRTERKRERENILFVLNLSSNCTNVCMSMKEREREGEKGKKKRK
jgi:hypothetical protein